jgi:hypothetical protein
MSLYGFEYLPPVPRKARGGRVGLLFPGAAAEKNNHPQLRVREAKGAGHRTQLLGALWNPARLDGQPCRRLHAGQTSCLLDRVGFLLAAALDGQAEDPAPELAVGLAEVVLNVNFHTHIHITPDGLHPLAWNSPKES